MSLESKISHQNISGEYIIKFVSRLGVVDDFVRHVEYLERTDSIHTLSNFQGTESNCIYMLVKKGGVVDFKHFFAAMTTSLTGRDFPLKESVKKMFPTLHSSLSSAKSEGNVLLFGLLNELKQCSVELRENYGDVSKLETCFSKEDMYSNRLGASFAESIIISTSENSFSNISTSLKAFLDELGPLSKHKIDTVKLSSTSENLLESAYALFKSLSDSLIPSAY